MTDDLIFDAWLARSWLAAVADAVRDHRDELTDLDSAIGDGDHGANLSRGFTEVAAVLAERVAADAAVGATRAANEGAGDGVGGGAGEGVGGGIADATADGAGGGASGGTGSGVTGGAGARRSHVLGEIVGEDLDPTAGHPLTRAGTTLISKVGGASGPLYGSALRAVGKALNTPLADSAALAAALRAGLDAIVRLGGAQVGDKTMVDAYAPAVDAFGEVVGSGGGLAAAAQAAADAAEAGAAGTIPLVARKGRASYLGPRSAGHQDPGATSTALLFRALADVSASRAGLV